MFIFILFIRYFISNLIPTDLGTKRAEWIQRLLHSVFLIFKEVIWLCSFGSGYSIDWVRHRLDIFSRLYEGTFK